MNIKEKFELVYNKSGSVYNILPIRKHTLEGFKVSNEDKLHLKILTSSYARTKASSSSFIMDNFDNIAVCRIDDYPLPASITQDNIPIINLSVLPSEFISDYTAADIYAMVLYALVLNVYITKKPFESEIESHISNFLIYTFMKLFAKRSGLLGSYKDKIPKLQLILSLYVNVSMMGTKFDDRLLSKLSNKYFIDARTLDVEKFNFNSIHGMFNALKHNNILSLSENSFSSSIINLMGVNSLPLFEDSSRFFATLVGSTVSGNSLFSSYFKKVNTSLYDKLVNIAYINVKRGL